MEVERLAKSGQWKTKIGISPHAPYTVPGDQIAGAIQLAHKFGLPWTTHWAETSEEVAFLAGELERMPASLRKMMDGIVLSPRQRPIDFLSSCMPTSKPRYRDECVGSIAHGNYLDECEFDRLAQLDLTVIYCPRAHRYFGHKEHPYVRLLQASVRVAVGTDSMASNEGLSPLEELRFLRRETPGAPSANILLRMVTLSAAEALQRPDYSINLTDARAYSFGALEHDMFADLAAFPIPAETDDPLETLIQTAPPAKAVWVAGERVL